MRSNSRLKRGKARSPTLRGAACALTWGAAIALSSAILWESRPRATAGADQGQGENFAAPENPVADVNPDGIMAYSCVRGSPRCAGHAPFHIGWPLSQRWACELPVWGRSVLGSATWVQQQVGPAVPVCPFRNRSKRMRFRSEPGCEVGAAPAPSAAVSPTDVMPHVCTRSHCVQDAPTNLCQQPLLLLQRGR